MPPSTHFLQDITRQPAELRRALAHFSGPGEAALQRAATLLTSAPSVFFTGIGASWNAAYGAAALLSLAERPAYIPEASELLHFATIPKDSVLVILSRTGRSIEVVQLLEKARRNGAQVIGITNAADGTLAREATIPIVVPVPLDHAISVNTYSSLALAAGALASAASGGFQSVSPSLSRAFDEVETSMDRWRRSVETSNWLAANSTYYFLARGPSLATCHQARLLWEEGAKSPATAMSTSGFRHGPQEIVRPGTRFCIWIDQAKMRPQDLSVAEDLRTLGASVALVGHGLTGESGDLVLQVPELPPGWQFLVDVIPIQLAAERLARISGVDCDSFRVCSFVVEDESGLLGKKAGMTKNGN